MRKSAEALVTGQQRARQKLVGHLQEAGQVDATTAEKVAALYLRKKLVRLDPIMGTAHVVHGALYDRALIRNAAKEA